MINSDRRQLVFIANKVYVFGDSNTLWTECRDCSTVITECWTAEADLATLLRQAMDHICGLDTYWDEVPD